MREILFRGKRADNGEWSEGLLGFNSNNRRFYIDNDGSSMYYILPETIGQYTGITAKNGQKIFEGDYDNDGTAVVFCQHCYGWEFGNVHIPTKEVVIPCHRCDGDFFFEDFIHDFIPIGTIHD